MGKAKIINTNPDGADYNVVTYDDGGFEFTLDLNGTWAAEASRDLGAGQWPSYPPLDFSKTSGTASFGYKLKGVFDPNTGERTYDLSGTLAGLGVSSHYKFGSDGELIESSGTGGVQLIAGEKLMVLGVPIGGDLIVRLGIEIDDDGIAFTAHGELSFGFVFGELSGEADYEFYSFTPQCFLAGTAIDMWDGSQKPIELVAPDDMVVSYDKRGTLVPGRVSRVFQQESKHILDLFGLMVTPGHVTLCGDGVFAGRHVPIIDILRSDGALVRKDGSKIRAATGVPLGDPKDGFIWAITGAVEPCGRVRLRGKGRIRLGTRFITEDGRDLCVADLIAAESAVVTADGLIQAASVGDPMPFHWTFTETLPKPEDYVLQRSALELADIYAAGEWDDMRPHLPAPILSRFGAALGTELGSAFTQDIDIAPNVPLSMRDASTSTAVH